MLGTQSSFTIGDVATLRGIPTKAVRRAISKGELVAERYNARVIRVSREALVSWVSRCQRREARAQVSKGHK